SVLQLLQFLDWLSFRNTNDAAEVIWHGIRGPRSRAAWEALMAAARLVGAKTRELSDLTSLNTSTVSRRHDSAVRRTKDEDGFRKLLHKIVTVYSQTK
ncbi:MAG: hypothetical protein ACK4S4_15095, partial [Pyrinomonadaceae bacterium]